MAQDLIPPLAVRRIHADMKLKHLKLRSVAQKAGVPYSVASDLLRGARVVPKQLARIAKVVAASPMPEEVRA